MGRIRTIKPEFFLDEELFDLEKQSRLPIRLAYAGLWTQADRRGRFEYRARTLKAAILPHDTANFGKILDVLKNSGRVCHYSLDGREYGWIRSWKRHQFINNKEHKSNFPPAPDELTAEPDLRTDDERDDDAMFTREERVPEGKERKGREERDGNGSGKETGMGTDLERSRNGKGTIPCEQSCEQKASSAGKETSPPPPPQGGASASSKNTKRMTDYIMKTLQLTGPSVSEDLTLVCEKALSAYPDESEDTICDGLLEMWTRYLKVADDERKTPITSELFFVNGLWRNSDHWHLFLSPLESEPVPQLRKQSTRTRTQVAD